VKGEIDMTRMIIPATIAVALVACGGQNLARIDSTSPDGVPVDATPLAGGESVLLAPRSLLLLRTP